MREKSKLRCLVTICSQVMEMKRIYKLISIFDASGNEISHCQNIKIPLKRNHETVVKGFFLTREVGKGNNVAIDDNFEGEYVVGID